MKTLMAPIFALSILVVTLSAFQKENTSSNIEFLNLKISDTEMSQEFIEEVGLYVVCFSQYDTARHEVIRPLHRDNCPTFSGVPYNALLVRDRN